MLNLIPLEDQAQIDNIGLISSYENLAKDLARITCRVSCAIAKRDAKGITKVKVRQHQKEFKEARKQQYDLIGQIFNNEIT